MTNRRITFEIAAIGMLLVLLVVHLWPGIYRAEAQATLQYSIINVTVVDMEEVLNTRAREGWEFAYVIDRNSPSHYRVLLKRGGR